MAQDLIPFVCFLIQTLKLEHVIEVGTGIGESAIQMAQVMPSSGLLVTIEPHEQSAELASEAFEAIQTNCKIVLRYEDPIALLKLWTLNPQENDLIIINNAGSNYQEYIDAAKTLLKPGGILIQSYIRPTFWQKPIEIQSEEKDDPIKWPSPHRRTLYKDLVRPEERAICKEAMQNTLASLDAIVSLIRSTEYIIKNDIPGVFIECGVWKGGNIETIIKTLLWHKVTDRDIYLFDTFEGFPEPGLEDYEFGVGPALNRWDARRDGDKTTGSNWLKVGFNEVRNRILALGYPEEHILFGKGLVEDTIPKCAPQQIALARFDTDFYSSTKHEFIHLYPRVSSGGIIIIDDYGTWRGSQQATDEYIKENNLQIYLNRVDEHVRLIIKP